MMEMMIFIANSILLGAGLAMDAFSVSLANGMNETKMKKGRMFSISGIFASFQLFMPMFGWLCVHTIVYWWIYAKRRFRKTRRRKLIFRSYNFTVIFTGNCNKY